MGRAQDVSVEAESGRRDADIWGTECCMRLFLLPSKIRRVLCSFLFCFLFVLT